MHLNDAAALPLTVLGKLLYNVVVFQNLPTFIVVKFFICETCISYLLVVGIDSVLHVIEAGNLSVLTVQVKLAHRQRGECTLL